MLGRRSKTYSVIKKKLRNALGFMRSLKSIMIIKLKKSLTIVSGLQVGKVRVQREVVSVLWIKIKKILIIYQ